jgi:hypothetical protein
VGTRVHDWRPRVALPMRGGPGLVLDDVLDVVTLGIDRQRVLRVLLRHVSLVVLDLQGEHLEELVLGSSLVFLLLISLP